MNKYIKLSNDNIDTFLHTPNKTLIYLIDIEPAIKTYEEYIAYYENNDFNIKVCDEKFQFGNSIIYNNYVDFINKIIHFILSF